MPDQSTVITVLNLKGGVGKTHTSWLIASVCQERSLRVLVVDADTQGNITSSFLSAPDRQAGIEALFNPAAEVEPTALVRRTAFSHIDLLPASAALARFDLSDQSQWEAAELHLALLEPVASLRRHYDFIVFDCPPRLSLVSTAALCAADGVVIPLEAADWGAQGIVQVTEAIRRVRGQFNPRLKLFGYLVSRFRRARSYQQGYLKQLRQHFGDQAFDTVIPDLAQFEKSVTDRIPITLHAAASEEAGIARCFFDELCLRAERDVGGGAAGGRAHVRRRTVAAA